MELSVRLPNISPEVNANIFSKLLFCWVLQFMKYASNHNLQIRDVYDTVDKDLAAHLREELEQNWNHQLKIGRIKNRTPCFSKALFSTFGKPFLLYGMLLFIQSFIIRIFHPIILSEFIIHFEMRTDDVIGWYMGSAIIFLAILNTFIYHHTYVGCSFIGMRARVATSSLLQKKVLRLSQTSLKRMSLCRLNKLLTEDVKSIEAAAPYFHYLYITPVQFISSAYILYTFTGVASCVGLTFMLLVSIPQGYISTLLKGIKLQLSIYTNGRVDNMKEILRGVRVIKMYGWEIPFAKIIEKSRIYELDAISKQIFVRCISISSLMFIQSTAVFLTITTQVLLGNIITIDAIFAQILIFFNLQQYVCYFFPESVERFLEAKASIRRIEDFFTMEEQEQLKIINCTKGIRKPGSIIVTDASAKWGTQLVLQDINLRIKPTSLNCIFGLPGSAKTSFLQMLLKELTPYSGRVDVVGTISYASQKPWLFPSTVKSNILFGQPYNRHKYREIVRICALDVDFQKLPYGDRALFMDKRVFGNNVLKEKISLARTIYKDADIYIIDDCFGSIDSQTEKFIFKECFLKYLKNKTRVFVSSKLYYAKEANTIVVFENGTISKTLDRDELTEEDFQYLNSKVSKEKNHFSSSNIKPFADETDLSNYEFEQSPVTSNRQKRGYFDTLAGFLKVSEKKYVVEIVLILFGISQLSAGISDVWLLQWIRHSAKNFTHQLFPRNEYLSQNKTSASRTIYHKLIQDFLFVLDKNHTKYITVIETDTSEETKIFGIYEKDLYITLYAAFIIICIIFTVVRSLLFHALCMKASRVLHSKMFEKVLFSPMKFFENYPSGKILQRFSKDMDVINQLPHKNFITLQMFSAVYGALLLIIFGIPSMILPMFLIAIMIYFLVSCFVATIRGLQRLNNNTNAPLQLFLSKSLLGVFTIRSAEAEAIISETFENLLDQHTSVWSLILMCSEYFCLYLDLIIILFLAVVTFFNVAVKTDHINNVYIGLAVTQSILLTETLHVGIRENIEVLSQNPVVNRALEYTQLATEKVNEATLVPKNWPYCGKIVFRNVYIKDNDGHGSFLKNLNIVLKPAEKIAVVSRFPEEKWTIVNCLLRLVPVEGLVLLDDVDTGQISLNKLRSTISVITKDPILFSSSIRFNLDPLDYANDEMIWKVLEEVGLKTSIQSLSQPIVDGQSNFSGGQKQLLCLARAILKNSKVIIVENNPCDIDSNIIMKKILQEKFKNSTVITIANNISTIMDNDKILVIEDGKEVEYAHAHELLKNTNGYLSRIVREVGPTEEKNLKRIAKENFDLRNLEIEFKFE
ncbi:ATP-binding cassette subfamily C member 4-like isoform X1 [Diabrotica undecimpunctata]|uniref:ATP-binding cassette subfamily C member 4-like isoform X1 n=2 Tax=Diabrotica undecimpunctata TaxID=50387 RepID=UPI003B63A433